MHDLPKASRLFSEKVFARTLAISSERPWLTSRNTSAESLLDFCKNDRERILVLDMLRNITYVTGRDLELHLDAIATTIAVGWGLDPKCTRIVSKNLDDGPDSSDAVVQQIKHRFGQFAHLGWTKSNFTRNVKSLLNDSSVSNIVTVDDFSGTGRQLDTFVRWCEEGTSEGQSISIYSCFVAAMEATLTRSYPKSLVKLFSCTTQHRGISDTYLETDLLDAVEIMTDIEGRMRTARKYRFGYEHSEALYYCETLGVPNNVFPLFWTRRGGPSKVMFDRI